MKKLLLSLAALLFLIFVTVYISISIIDYNKIFQDFVISSNVDINKLNKSKITTSDSFIPIMQVDEISMPGIIELKDITITISPISILTFNPKISSIIVNKAAIYLNNDDVGFVKHDEFISELIVKNSLSVKAQVNELKFVESDNDVPIIINNFSFNGELNGNAEFKGVLSLIGSIKGSFKKTDNNVNFELIATDENYSFDLNENYQNGLLSSGNINIKTNRLFNKLTKFIPELNGLASYLNNGDEVEISCLIVPAKDNIVLDKININSNSINGNGIIRFSKKLPNLTETKFIFSKINLINHLKHEDIYSDNNNLYNSKHFDLSKDTIIADIQIAELILNKENTIKDINLKIKSEDNAINIQDLSGKMGLDSYFKVSGNVTQNSFRSLFNGKVDLKYQDLNDVVSLFGIENIKSEKQLPFELTSNVKFSAVDLLLQNLSIKTDDNILTGNISTKFIGKYPRTNANLKFTNIDVDKKNFPVFYQSSIYIQSLLDGIKEENYLNKYIPIRKINSINNIDVTFDQININNKLYKNLNFNLIIAPGNVAADHLNINDGKNWIYGSFAVEAQGVKPNLTFKIYDGSINADYLSAPGLFLLRQKILDNIDLSKMNISMQGKLKNLYDVNLAMNEISFDLKNDKNLITISKFDANVLSGKLNSSGSILLAPYTINMVYALNSAYIEDISKLLPEGLINKDGKISVSGMLSTNGEKIEDQLYNLYIKANVIMKGAVLGNISLDDFIEKTRDPKYDLTALNDDLNKMLLTGNTLITDLKTDFELIKGLAIIQPIIFKTKYASSSGSAKINLYNFNVDANSSFLFLIGKLRQNLALVDYVPATIDLKAKGEYFALKKEAESSKLIDILKTRNLK